MTPPAQFPPMFDESCILPSGGGGFERESVANVYQEPSGRMWYGKAYPEWFGLPPNPCGYRVRIKRKSLGKRVGAVLRRLFR